MNRKAIIITALTVLVGSTAYLDVVTIDAAVGYLAGTSFGVVVGVVVCNLEGKIP